MSATADELSATPSAVTRRFAKVAAVVGMLALLVASCGTAGDDDNGDDDNGEAQVGVSDEDVVIEATGDPEPGGRLAYGLEADTDGLVPHTNRWAISGIMLAQAVYDPLTALNVDGEPRPYLAESIEPNEDYDVWTITLREGVQFHDGEPLTSEAVKLTFDAHRRSGLTGSAFVPIEEVEIIDDLTVEVRMRHPWVAFPAALTSQVGFVVSPKMVPAPELDEDGNPDPESLAAVNAEAEQFTREPIGTGPFVQQSWSAGTWVGGRNENYWRPGLPYLEELEFRSISDTQARRNALVSRELQMIHTSDPATIARLRDEAAEGLVQIVEDRGESEESFILLNVESEGPVGDIRIRRALAYATDVESYNEAQNEGIAEIARGPFKQDSEWYVETDYPTYDLDEAIALVEDYVADTGQTPRFTLATTASPTTERAVSQLQQQWGQAGIEVDIETLDQTEFINTAIFGTYEANLWRQFGAIDPDVDLIWWAGWLGEEEDGTPRENILNFANNRNPDIDDALQRGRQNAEQSVRAEAYADFQNLLTADMPYIWLNHSLWAVAATTEVRDITNGTLPDGEESIPLGGNGTFGGTHRLTQVWLER
ncbi:MAG: hypothetical protein JJU45_00090 [Acidimicrobiia bacterium]|nr:hypothetical protein [Acidimicrobiia bacterium]